MNILNEIFERLEYERLLSEGKDPIEALRFKYPNVPNEVIDKLVSIDPTKKKSYSQWVLSHWDDERKTILRNLKNGRLEQLFKFVKGNNDVQLAGFRSVETPLNEYIPEVEDDYEDDEDEEEEGDDSGLPLILRKSNAPTTLLKNHGWEKQVESDLANDFDIVFNEDNWIIAVPHSYEADCKLGENMHWCTAGGLTDFKRGRHFYDEYLGYGGEYYVNFDMTQGESSLGVDYPFTRYQFHFESHQFKDMNDSDVDALDGIGMPDSAREYYLNEGYDESDFESNEEREEEYENERNNWFYNLAEGLYLGIEYDNEYHFEEPNEGTSFYIFSENDWRDPIDWETFPNPFVDDSFIIRINENCLILKESDDNYRLCSNEPSRYGGNDWATYEISAYVKGGDGVFTVSDKETLCYWDSEGPAGECVDTKVSECEKMFMNDDCGDAGMFVEINMDGEFHSLYMYDSNEGELKCIVKKDIPLDGVHYVIGEDGVIRGKYGIYRVDGESVGTDVKYYDGSPFRYHFEDELDDGLYIVSIAPRNEYGNYIERYNVVTKWGERPLFETWYDEILNYRNGIFVVKRKSINIIFIDIRENQIGGEYNNYGFINGTDTLVGVGRNNSPVDIINVPQKRVVAIFKSLVTNQYSNGCLLLRDDNDSVVFYDYSEQKVVDPGFDVIDTIGKYYTKQLYCANKRSGSKCIVNINDLSVVVDGISDMSPIKDSYDEAYLLTKVNGKKNIYAKLDYYNNGNYESQWKEALPEDVDDVTDLEWLDKMVFITNNGRYYIYKFKDGDVRYLINPNGFPVQGKYDGYYGYIWFDSGSFEIAVKPDNGRLARWRSMGDCGSGNFPPEVIDFYNKIVGNESSPSGPGVQEPAVSTVGESFMRFMKRLNEADGLRRNVIYD